MHFPIVSRIIISSKLFPNESIVKIGKIEFDGEGRAKIATQRSEIIYVVNLVHGHRFRHVSREGERGGFLVVS